MSILRPKGRDIEIAGHTFHEGEVWVGVCRIEPHSALPVTIGKLLNACEPVHSPVPTPFPTITHESLIAGASRMSFMAGKQTLRYSIASRAHSALCRVKYHFNDAASPVEDRRRALAFSDPLLTGIEV